MAKKDRTWKDQIHTIEQRRDAIGALMDEYRGIESEDLCRALHQVKLDEEALKVQEQRLSERKEAIGQLLADLWEVKGISSMDVEGIGAFSLQTRLHVSTGDKDVYKAWLRANDMGALIQETVAAKTTESLVRERMEDGQPCDQMGLNIVYKTIVR